MRSKETFCGELASRFDEEATFFLATLPAIHKDPFDRMLVCQALAGALTLVTPDEHIARYPVRTLW